MRLWAAALLGFLGCARPFLGVNVSADGHWLLSDCPGGGGGGLTQK